MDDSAKRSKRETSLATPSANARAQRILDAAAALIAHYGYDKTTVGDIAREAAVSKGAVYLHWESKEALFEALLRREARRLTADLWARVEADPEGGTIGAVYRHGLLAVLASPFMRALSTRDARVLGDYVRRRDPAERARRLRFAQDYVRRMQAVGLLRDDLDAAVIAQLLSILSYGLLTVPAPAPPAATPTLEETLTALADLVQRGLAPPSGGDNEAGKRALRSYLDEATALLEADAGSPPENAVPGSRAVGHDAPGSRGWRC